MNLKPFNLEKALAGEPVVTRDGRIVTEIMLCKTASTPIVFVCNGEVYATAITGQVYDFESILDLFMVPKIVKKSGWLNIYPNSKAGYDIHDVKQVANNTSLQNRVACVFVEWEEEE